MIGKADFDEFADVASVISNEALEDFRRFWAQLDFSDVAAARNACIEYIVALVETYGTACAVNAAEFFELASGTANAHVVDALHEDRIDQTVRYAMKFAVDGVLDEALSVILADMNLQIQGAGRDTMIENARRTKTRFGRVPRGSSTCEFCVMLAARGFDYWSEETAGDLNRFHPGCDCQIVAGLPGDRLPGYDPKHYYMAYRDCVKTCGSSDEKKVLAEMRTRDRTWLNTGVEPKIEYLKPRESFIGTHDEKDLAAHDALKHHGFAITVPEEDAPDGYSNIDLMIKGHKWEVKSPKSSNIRAVESNLRKAKKQFEKQYGSSDAPKVVFNGLDIGIPDEKVIAKIESEMKRHGITEVLYIAKDETVKRIQA